MSYDNWKCTSPDDAREADGERYRRAEEKRRAEEDLADIRYQEWKEGDL